MKIWFKDRYRRMKIRSKAIIRLVARVLAEMEEQSAEVGLLLTGDAEMRRLNRRYRGIDRATDVLAFAMDDQASVRQRRMARSGSVRLRGIYPNLLGDVVVSVQMAKRQAIQEGHSFEREMAVLIIHGLLHLLGYDHERSQAAAKAMRQKEKELLEAVSGERF